VCWLILLRLSSSWTVLPFSYSHDIGSSLALLPLLSSCHSERTRCFGYLLIVVLFFAELTSISISGCRRFGFSFSLHFSPEGFIFCYSVCTESSDLAAWFTKSITGNWFY
jgi:hypothetical protein